MSGRILCLSVAALSAAARGDLPSCYDLRDHGWVTEVRNQSGCGSCWCFGTMASIESSLLMHAGWQHGGEPDLSENHLNWHHGFDPIPPCMGGDYRMTSAYFSRGSGPVLESDAPYKVGGLYQYSVEPPEVLPVPYYIRDIEWYDTVGEIKAAVMNHGAVATCWAYDYGTWLNDATYQGPEVAGLPNHSVTIVGWDDAWVTAAPQPGAWQVRNSWGESWSGDGYFGMSYYDKHAGKDPEMGAVSFHNVVGAFHKTIHHHDAHGWCAEKAYAHAFNAFTAAEREKLSAVSFYTTADAVGYELKVYTAFSGGQLGGLAASGSGTIDFKGFHTIDLGAPVALMAGEAFYVYLYLDNGEQAIDCTVMKDVLMGDAGGAYEVVSEAHPGESFYSADGSAWADLYDEHADHSANFCIKGLTTELLLGDATLDDSVDYLDLGVLASRYNQPGGWTDGDFTADGLVNYLDLGILATHYGAGGGGPVPEPAAAILLVAGWAALRRPRRRA